MITSQCIQRLALSAALLILPLIIYCGDMAGNPHQADGSAQRDQTATASLPSAAGKFREKHEVRARQILADIENRSPDAIPDTSTD